MFKLTSKIYKYPFGTHNLADAGNCGIIGAGFMFGQHRPGVDKGPGIIREHGLHQNLTSLGYNIQDYGDLKFELVKSDVPDANVQYPLTTGNANYQISEMVQKSLKENDKTIVLGGDHSIAIGSIHGHSQHDEDFCVLFIDAHADINTPCSSYSGNIHGQVISYLLKSDLLDKHIRKVRGFEWLTRVLRPERLAYIGLRDLDKAEVKILEDLGIMYCSMYSVDRDGIAASVLKCMDKINPSGKRSTHISFDIDSLDPDYAPATGTPVPGGLYLRDAQYIGEFLNEEGINVKVLDMVEVNPSLSHRPGDDIRTAKHANHVIKSMMGYYRGGQYESGAKMPEVTKVD